MASPEISVVLPVYNAERTVGIALRSVLQQSIIDNIEVIAINDGSSDDSLSILQEWGCKHKKLRIIILKELQKVNIKP